MESLLTLGEVAELLKVSERTVLRRVEAGELVGVKVGRAWRFTREDLQNYLEKARQE